MYALEHMYVIYMKRVSINI